MALVSKGLLKGVWFGFSADRLLIRVDTEGGAANERLAEVSRVRVGFVDPADWEVVLTNVADPRPSGLVNHAGAPSSNGTTVEVACGKILELAVPFGRLGLKAGDPIRFYVEVLDADASLDRAPREGIFELTVPTPDFEKIMWQV
jgi:hypothetical protein